MNDDDDCISTSVSDKIGMAYPFVQSHATHDQLIHWWEFAGVFRPSWPFSYYNKDIKRSFYIIIAHNDSMPTYVRIVHLGICICA